MNNTPLLSALTLCLALAAPAAAQEPDHAQPTLPTQKITILSQGGARHDFTVEMALTDQQQQVGEMFRTTVLADGGMLFDWGTPREVPMWMENTLVPLDMVFVRDDGTVGKITENAVPLSLANIPSGGPVRATIELQAGITAKLDIRVGDRVRGAMFK